MRRYLFALLLCLPVLSSHAQYMSTFAGQGYMTGYSGDGGAATAALMYSPSDVAFDSKGNLYIADFVNQVIRKVDTFGIITTFAGTGSGAGTLAGGGFSGDGGPATAALLNGPFAVVVDPGGNVIFADGYNHRVRKVSATGIITTIAGVATPGYTGDGGPATNAELNNPVGLALDRAGNLYIADDHNNVVRKVNSAGIISTVAGNTIAAYSGDGFPATVAALNLPIGVAIDTAQNLYIADSKNNVIRMVNTSGIISTVAGSGTAGYTGDNGAATAATLDTAQRINFDDSNNMYISDFYNNVIRKVDAITHVITTVAGNGAGAGSTPPSGSFSGDDSLATNAGLFFPCGVAFDSRHRMYIADRGNDVIRRVGPEHTIDHTAVNNVSNLALDLLLFPNPSNGDCTITFTSPVNEKITIIITDLLGETVFKADGMTNKQSHLLLNQPPGVYIVTAVSATRVKQVKRLLLR